MLTDVEVDANAKLWVKYKLYSASQRRAKSRSHNFTDLCTVLLFVVLLFYVHGKHLRSCREGQLT